jgi:nicotinamide-nucleotide amidase
MPEMAAVASIAIIGDEILCGKVVDTNSPFLVTELHRLGWKVHKVTVLPDSVHVISRSADAFMTDVPD